MALKPNSFSAQNKKKTFHVSYHQIIGERRGEKSLRFYVYFIYKWKIQV